MIEAQTRHDQDKPVFSVAITTFEQRHFLEACLKAICSQSYQSIELIICDDFSCDFDVADVEMLIERIKTDNIVRTIVYRQAEHVGITMNCQKAYELASGSFFKTLEANMHLANAHTLAQVADYFSKNTEANVLAGRYGIYREDSGKKNMLEQFPRDADFQQAKEADADTQFRLLSIRRWPALIASPAVFWRKAFLDEMGGYDIRYKQMDNWPLWVRMTKLGYRIDFVDYDLALSNEADIVSGVNDAPNQTYYETNMLYEEYKKLLSEECLPEMKRRKSIGGYLRCWYAAKEVEFFQMMRYQWNYMSAVQRLNWKLRNIPMFVVRHVFSAQVMNYNRDWKNKLIYRLFTCISACLIYFWSTKCFLWSHEGIRQIAQNVCIAVAIWNFIVMLAEQFNYLTNCIIFRFSDLLVRRRKNDE